MLFRSIAHGTIAWRHDDAAGIHYTEPPRPYRATVKVERPPAPDPNAPFDPNARVVLAKQPARTPTPKPPTE